MPSENGKEQIVVQVSVTVINKGREDDRCYHQKEYLKDFAVGFFAVACVFGCFSQNAFPVYPVNEQHKAKACQHTGSRSEGSAGSTEFRTLGVICRKLLDKEPGCTDTESSVEYLLDDL